MSLGAAERQQGVNLLLVCLDSLFHLPYDGIIEVAHVYKAIRPSQVKSRDNSPCRKCSDRAAEQAVGPLVTLQ